MKKLLLVLFALLGGISSFAQILQPAKWNYEVSKKEVKAGETVDLVFTATITKDWYLYSNDFDPNLGPMVTTFVFTPNDSYQPVGKVQPVKPKKKYDDIWEGEYTYFTGKGEFRQTVKILKANPKITGTIDYQVCSEVDGKCIPNTEEFTFANIKVVALDGQAGTGDEPSSRATDAAVSGETTPLPATPGPQGGVQARDAELTKAPVVASLSQPAGNAPYSMGAFMLLAFLSGLVALLTPCVFPMVPMTVTFFTNNSASRGQAISKAVFYGLSIIVLYILIGTVVSLINGPGFANFLSTHWVPNVFFFLVFVFFALSFLGMFDLNIPGTVITKVDAQADKGGYLGVFFMAFTIVLVSFSCTGPIVGSILIESAGGQVIKPVLGMFAFSLAFALPFSLFAIFPNWLKSLPRSGGWLNSVKVVLGFLELALALKFLSIADQVYHWGILDREVFLAFWIVIFSLIGFYLLGKIRLPHDDKLENVSVPRMLLATITLTFVVYLVPGMFGAPLKSLSGYLPPQTTQDFDLNKASTGLFASNPGGLDVKPKYAEFLKLPHGLQGFFDYQQALQYARKANKPIFIDFTGHGCVNCREMEARVWSDPEVLRRLSNDYVVLALYVDDKYELPESAWYTSAYDGKVKKTIGAQNADLQITKFNNNAQPYYTLIDGNGNLLVAPKAYDLNVEHFAAFLDSGLAAYKKAGPGYVPMPVSTLTK
jgi:thiol:disulfide interchange protein DsbD